MINDYTSLILKRSFYQRHRFFQFASGEKKTSNNVSSDLPR